VKNYLNTTLRNVFWFKKVNDNNELEMKPPFQRNPVWVTKQKSFLIDSILNGYPVPEIYMQEEIHGVSDVRYILVDGQQRIRAVLEYLEGKFKIDSKDSQKWGGKYFEDLEIDEKRKLLEYNFVVRILPIMDDDEIRTIFQRLNRNVVSLNKQELRQATYWGPFIKLMNDLANHPLWTKIDVFTQNDIRRMLDVEYVSELTIAYLHGLQNKKQSLDKYYQMYEETFEQEEEVRFVFDTVLTELIDILPNIDETRWSKKTDFYTLFLIFAKNKSKLPLDSEKKVIAREILTLFGKQIDESIKVVVPDSDEDSDRDETTDYYLTDFQTTSENVKIYVSGIRASSDLGSRRRREESLEKELSVVF
jgi:hypothetical protein